MLEFEKTYPTIRAYFNTHSQYPWSVDDGDQSNEMTVPSIITQGVSLWKYNGQKANENSPVAWVEFSAARIHRVEDTDEIFIENDSDY